MKNLLFTISIWLLSSLSVYSQCAYPDNFEDDIRQKYDNLDEHDKDHISFEDYLESEKNEYCRLKDLEENPQNVYNSWGDELSPRSAANPCENGDFANRLQDWTLAYSSIKTTFATPHFAPFTAGNSGRVTIESAGLDPKVGIQKLPKNGGLHSLKIGDDDDDYHVDLVSKQYTVTANNSIVTFWYAIVLEYCDFTPAIEQTAFRVRVWDRNNEISNATVNIGNGTNIIQSSTSDPFLNRYKTTKLYYRDWQCATIDLSNYVGKTVNIEFIANDCAWGGHYGYAYIDNFCGSCSESNFSIANATTDKCGKGNIKVNYVLPTANGVTGSVNLTLLYDQNGGSGKPIGAPVTRTAGTSNHSFNIEPSTLSLNTSLKYFDYWVKADFFLNGTNLGTQYVGIPRTGQISGNNNDYEIICSSAPQPVDCIDECYWKLNGNDITPRPNSFIGTVKSHPFVMKTFATERMRITEGGNVGIGTQTPDARLHVRDAIRIDAIPTAPNTRTGDLRLYSGDNTGRPGFIEFNKPNDVRLGGIGYGDINMHYYGLNTAGHHFFTENGTSNNHPRFRIHENGQVGVGEIYGATPDEKFYIIGNSTPYHPNRSASMLIENENAGSLRLYGGGPVSALPAPNGMTGMIQFNRINKEKIGHIGWSANNMHYVSSNTAHHVFYTQDGINERMRVMANGNVGIGTDDPQQRLHVLGRARISQLPQETNRLITANANGDLGSIGFPGNQTTVLRGDGQWVPMPAGVGSAANGIELNNNVVQLGRSCSASSGAELLENRFIPLNNSNIFFGDGPVHQTVMNNNRVAIGDLTGSTCNSIFAKLQVSRMYRQATNEAWRSGITSIVSDGEAVDQFKIHTEVAFNGLVDGKNSQGLNIGSRLVVKNGSTNSGIQIESGIGSNPISSNSYGFEIQAHGTKSFGGRATATGINEATGGQFNARGSQYNVGVLASTENSSSAADYGVYAYFAGAVPGANDWAIFGAGRTGSTSGVFLTSDEKLKTNVSEIANPIELLSKIQPKKYAFKHKEFPYLNLPQSETNYGVLAQELEEVLPSLIASAQIKKDEEGNKEEIKLVNYTEMIPIAIAAIKELNAKVEKQNNAVIENEALKSELATVKEKLVEL
jgi:hypothetical protein